MVTEQVTMAVYGYCFYLGVALGIFCLPGCFGKRQ
jgi:hypothetical protein